jgi:hypothetical protein
VYFIYYKAMCTLGQSIAVYARLPEDYSVQVDIAVYSVQVDIAVSKTGRRYRLTCVHAVQVGVY